MVQRLITSGVVQRGGCACGCGAVWRAERRAGAVRRCITSLTRASDTTVQAEEPLALSVSPATYNRPSTFSVGTDVPCWRLDDARIPFDSNACALPACCSTSPSPTWTVMGAQCIAVEHAPQHVRLELGGSVAQQRPPSKEPPPPNCWCSCCMSQSKPGEQRASSDELLLQAGVGSALPTGLEGSSSRLPEVSGGSLGG